MNLVHVAGAQLFGAEGGRRAIYLHGTPGAAQEAQLIAASARAAGIELVSIERARVSPGASGEAYLQALKQLVLELGAGERIAIVGFSIGAALALRLASRLGAAVGPLVLFSTAGPLDVPGAFSGMGAGANLFRAARARGRLFDAAVHSQAFLGRRAPDLLSKLLFSGAAPSDQAFAASAAGRALLRQLLRRSFADGGAGYTRDLAAYVQDWSAELAGVTARVEMWHGVQDTWAPAAMADAVARRCPRAALRRGDGGHYTTLAWSAEEAMDVLLAVDADDVGRRPGLAGL